LRSASSFSSSASGFGRRSSLVGHPFQGASGLHLQVNDDARGPDCLQTARVGYPPPTGRRHEVSGVTEFVGQCTFEGTKPRFAAFRKDLGNWRAFATFDLDVEVEKVAAERVGCRLTDRGLARSGKPDENDVRDREVSC